MGFRAGTKNTDLNEEGAVSQVVGRKIYEGREARRRAMEIESPNKISWVIQSFCAFKSPQPNEIDPAFSEKVEETLIGLLTRIARVNLSLGYIPRVWRRSSVVFIPKAGRISHTSARDFWSISITYFNLKIVERLLDIYKMGFYQIYKRWVTIKITS